MCSDIIIGVLASLVATIVWVIFTSFYVVGGRKKIDNLLEYASDTNNLLRTSLEWEYYNIALSQIDKLIEILLEVDSNIGRLSYCPKKRKLIYTMLFHSIRTLSVFKNLEVGYEGDSELIARCKKFRKKYYYNINISEIEYMSQIEFILDIIKRLNKSKESVRKVLVDQPKLRELSNDEKKRIYFSLIEVNSFFYKDSSNYYMRDRALTKGQYEKIINETFKT